MPINSQELILLVSDVTRHEDIRISIKSSVKGGVITGVAATLGGILLGPPGLVIGKCFLNVPTDGCFRKRLQFFA